MTTFTALFKTAAAITLISGGSALAENNPPTKYQCWDGSIKTDPSYCPTMTPAQHETWAQSKSNATGGNASATGGNAQQAQGQQQGQSQSSRNDNQSSASASGGNQAVNIDNSNRQRMAANPVYVAGVTATGNPCAIGGGVGGSSIGRTAGGNFTVLDKACANKMHDLQIIDRTCAYLTQAECRATIAYLEPQARAGMIAAGTIRERVQGVTVSVSRHEQGDGSFTRAMNRAVRVGRDN